jgi:hypothetical protein
VKDFPDVACELCRELGLALVSDPKETPRSIRRGDDGQPVFEVHALRPCRRIGPDGQEVLDLVCEIVQRRKAFFEPKIQQELDDPKSKAKEDAPRFHTGFFDFRGGCTLILDAETGQVRYCIRKRITDKDRLERERTFRMEASGSLRAMFFESDDDNPFPSLHLDD